jgi:integrase
VQKGRIYRKGHSWILDYAVKELRDGKPKWANRSKRLAPVCDDYRTPASVRHLAADHLAPQNAQMTRPESTDTVTGFIENKYLLHCKLNLRPSTHAGYKFLFKMLKPHLGDERLRDFGPVEGERVLADFAAEKQRANTMLKNVKGFLSGAFRYAVRTGAIRFNPMRETVLPRGGKPMAETDAYTLDHIQSMLKVLDEPARTLVLVAALTGLRLAELRGLMWIDLGDGELAVKRSVWRTHIGETKTPAGAATVPVLPVVADALALHHKRSKGEFIFAGGTGKPLVIANLTRRDIIPVMAKKKIAWHGWHGFRRGLATNLYELGVHDKVIQAILRHANVEVTRKHYIKTRSAASAKAMKRLGRAFRRTENRTEK